MNYYLVTPKQHQQHKLETDTKCLLTCLCCRPNMRPAWPSPSYYAFVGLKHAIEVCAISQSINIILLRHGRTQWPLDSEPHRNGVSIVIVKTSTYLDPVTYLC